LIATICAVQIVKGNGLNAVAAAMEWNATHTSVSCSLFFFLVHTNLNFDIILYLIFLIRLHSLIENVKVG